MNRTFYIPDALRVTQPQHQSSERKIFYISEFLSCVYNNPMMPLCDV